ncbi:V-type sodium ATPase subunit B [Candidatus Calditenuaceae archaeon HR02]|nr:V-type sodium ATPase subunit B [Candidatus Calditenuaceae archaeon HR02]
MKRSRSGGGVEYTTVLEIRGPLLVVDRVTRVAYDELVEVETPSGESRLGRVLEVGEGKAIVQVFEGTSGLSIEGVKARFLGDTMKLGVSEELLGRVFDGLGRPIDGLPPPPAEDYRDISGEPINPEQREYPSDFIQTGISAIDVMNSLVRGQKLPVFSGPGLTHNILAAQIARQAVVPGKEEEFAVIFAALGVQNDEARFFRRSLEESGAMGRSALFLNLADDPAVERIITPRVALTLAEFLAFERDYNILVIITDMTNYCFAGDTELIFADGTVREIGAFVEEAHLKAAQALRPVSSVVSAGKGMALLSYVTPRELAHGSVLSWDGFSLRECRIQAVEKIVAPRRLLLLRTRSGASLKVTPDQRLLVDTLSGPELVRAERIRPGDELYSVERLEFRTERIPLLRLLAEREPERFFVHLRDDRVERALEGKYGSLSEACRRLNLSYERVTDSHAKRRYRLDEFLRVVEDLGWDVAEATALVDHMTADGKQRVRLREAYVTPDLTRLLGMVLSDGTVNVSDGQGAYYVSFSNRSRELVETFIDLFRRVFDGPEPQVHENSNGVTIVRFNSLIAARILLNLAKLGTPEELLRLLTLEEDHIAAFIAGYINGDGSVARGGRAVRIATRSRMRASRIQLLLKRLGVPSVIQERRSRSSFSGREVYDVVVTGPISLERLGGLVRPSHPGKRWAISVGGSRTTAERFYLGPRVVGQLLRRLRERYGLMQEDIGPSSMVSQVENLRRRVCRSTLSGWLRSLEEKARPDDPDLFALRQLIYGNYVLDEVVSVEEIEPFEEYVYDLTVEGTHKLLVANGIIASNCEALREISAAREEVPGRKGYPGYMYSDLASIYERAGRIKGKKGTITQMPILTMPSDDITHPVPDLTGYITEGQIVLSRDLHRKGIYPPINVLMSLSRLMGPGVIAPKKTRPDHGDVSNQLYASYSRAVQLRSLAEIVGKSSLSAQDIKLIEFGDLFENRFLRQGVDENRSLDESLSIAWEILSTLPEDSLTKIKPEFIKQYYKKAG